MNFFAHRTKDFYPLTLTNPLPNILFGTRTLGQRWQSAMNEHSSLSHLWVEPTILPDPNLIKAILRLENNQILYQEEVAIAGRPAPSRPVPDHTGFSLSTTEEKDKIKYYGSIRRVESLQYLIDTNIQQIIRDWEDGLKQGIFTRHPDFKDVHIDASVQVSQCLIDDGQGPVIISKDVTILPGARLMGPLVLLPGSLVKMGAEFYPGTTVGPFATVNGEIKNAIIHEYTAKGHFGFLGDSILGRWNNLGAGTTTSNVSNTFSKVSLTPWDGGPQVSYSTLKRGVVTGDFVKFGIHSKTGQGTAIGSFSSLAVDGFFDGNVPALSWWTSQRRTTYKTDLLRQHCHQQMQLRNQTWTEEWENALSSLINRHS